MPVTIELAVAKTHKYASRESGDTVEIIERPRGGFSTVIADGQGSGTGAKSLSLLVAGRAVGLLNEGVRDGAAARATHDFLFAHRSGKVSAALDIVSVDLSSQTVLFTRNSEVPMVLVQDGRAREVDDSGGRIGLYHHTRPRVLEFPCSDGLSAVIVTDGVSGAGSRKAPGTFSLPAAVEKSFARGGTPQDIADHILEQAVEVDGGRPADDMTVLVLRLGPGVDSQPIRRIAYSIPLRG
ncbi:MAG: serine/threonine-protein phosphatase [Sphaerobacteraceae bacterium]|nr:MAG: serine/threonine-protein phosphatase [Sphaerobacteraceae bacterium]